MSKTAAIGLVPTSTLFGRLVAAIDRLLTAQSASPFATATCPVLVSEPGSYTVSGVGSLRARDLTRIHRLMAPVSGAIFMYAGGCTGFAASATNWPLRQRQTKTVCNVAYHIQECV